MTDDAHRFTGMYDECRQRVWAYVVARAGRQVADEVVSETFAIAWRRLDDVPEPALPWLLGVARNVLRDNVRAEIRREAMAAELRAWTEGDVADQVTERMGVLRALAALQEDDREILVLVAWHGLTPKEAARVIGCSSAAYRVRLHRARKRLRQAMEAVGEPPAAAGGRSRSRAAEPSVAGGRSRRRAAESSVPHVRNLSEEWS
ncbi:RNA polymerase sigma factor [Nonomuraea candida]|uniref:RNA polymerase sigma factor n=1 Tax=Nonomuraea candida TaxID=359159 RepID=UPI000B0C8BE4|nr:RNA polymerase sigma factor [Nonomuraea candida]